MLGLGEASSHISDQCSLLRCIVSFIVPFAAGAGNSVKLQDQSSQEIDGGATYPALRFAVGKCLLEAFHFVLLVQLGQLMSLRIVGCRRKSRQDKDGESGKEGR